MTPRDHGAVPRDPPLPPPSGISAFCRSGRPPGYHHGRGERLLGLPIRLETFLARCGAEGRAVPRFVVRELRAYLRCGIVAWGFVMVRCLDCGHDRIVAYSCKGRAFCPSCGGRRMADTAAHLVDRVFPEVPVRQWVLSLPRPLRFLLGYDRTLCGEVLGVFMRVVLGWQERRARGLFGVQGARGGAVTAIQRFGSALDLNVHFHSLVLDGVHVPAVEPGGSACFRELPAPTDDEVERVLATVVRRVTRLLVRRGRLTEREGRHLFEELPEGEVDSLLATCQEASVRGRIGLGARAGQLVPRLGDRIDVETLVEAPKRRCASMAGYSLHADVAVPARDRDRLERLCRYVMRPPLATERLTEHSDGRLAYVLRRPWREDWASHCTSLRHW